MSEVWLAQRHGSSQLVVIKQLLAKHARHEITRKRILREAELGALLHHPNIARTIDAGRTGETIYLATEYLPGKDLEALSHTLAVRREFVPRELVAYIMNEVLAGLHAAHEAVDASGRRVGLVHRDLSPRNIQLCFDGTTKIIDFGLAHAQIGGLRTEPGAILGTYRYMSPEQAIGEPVDHRSDLFSLGTSMYELFSGQWLFDHQDKTDILRAIVESRHQPPSHYNPSIPKTLDAVVMRAMAHHPSERFPSALHMRNALAVAVPEWVTTPPPALAALLEKTFPNDALRTRAHAIRAQKRHVPAGSQQVLITREQKTLPDIGSISTLKKGAPQPPIPDEHTDIVRVRHPVRALPHINAGNKETQNRVSEPVRLPGRSRAALREVNPAVRIALQHICDPIGLLGQGGMGQIYLAHRDGERDFCVVKLLDTTLVEPNAGLTIKRFRREADILRRANHPCIPRCLAFDEQRPDSIFMVMEFVDGIDLQYLAESSGGRIEPEILIPLALDYLEGLDHIHALTNNLGEPMNAVHRDLSPNNLMVTFEGKAKIIDFGIARRSDESLTAVQGVFLGKPEYCSPEQATGVAVDRRSDIYSFGLVLYELLTGQPVVPRGLPLKEALLFSATQTPEELSAVAPQFPIPLGEVLAKAYAKNADERFQTAGEFRTAIKRASEAYLDTASKPDIAQLVRERASPVHELISELRDQAIHEPVPILPSALLKMPSGVSNYAKGPFGFQRPIGQIAQAVGLVGLGILLGLRLSQHTQSSPQIPETQKPALVKPPPPRVETRTPHLAAVPSATSIVEAPPQPKKEAVPPRTRRRAVKPPPQKIQSPTSSPKTSSVCEDKDHMIEELRQKARESPETVRRCIDSLEFDLNRSPQIWQRGCQRCLKLLRAKP